MIECAFCGDPARNDIPRRKLSECTKWRVSRKQKTVPLCQECFDEITSGIIRNQNINFFGGDYGPYKDDPGPWHENAVRCMEGD